MLYSLANVDDNIFSFNPLLYNMIPDTQYHISKTLHNRYYMTLTDDPTLGKADLDSSLLGVVSTSTE